MTKGSVYVQRLVRINLLLILLLVPVLAKSQVIVGKITDEKTGEPMPFANVFINNTTIGATTDINGDYKIEGDLSQNLEIVASFVGYTTKYRKISFGNRIQIVVNFQLVSKESQLDEVTLKSKRDKRWERNLKKFKRVFLAVPNDPFFKKNEILNPWVIDFEEGKTRGSKYLLASASEPLKVSNLGLGYNLDYHLREFIQTRDGFHYFGLVNFHEIDTVSTEEKKSWEDQRNSTYFGSLRHFLHSLLHDEAKSQGYRLYLVDSFPPKTRTNVFHEELGNSIKPLPFDSLKIDTLPNGNFGLYWPDRVEIHFKKKTWANDYYTRVYYPLSWITSPTCYFEFDANGIPTDPRQIIFSGYMGRHRVGRFLPHDFVPSKDYLTLFSEIDTALLGQTRWNSLREKPYLTFNKSYYTPGETVWFNARMIYQNQFLVDSMSRVLYVDLVNEKKELVIQETFEIREGMSKGQLKLGSDLKAGNYTIRAYTNWMRYYPEADYFYKPLPLISADREVISSTDVLPSDQEGEEISIAFKTDIAREELFNKANISISVLDMDSSFVDSDFSISLIDADLATFIGEEKTIETEINWIGTELGDYEFPEEEYNIEYGISVEGIFSDREGKPLDVPLTVVLGQMEDYGVIKSDTSGYFWGTGLLFTDSAEVAIAALNQRRKSFGNISLIEPLRPEVLLNLPKLQLETRPKSTIGKLDIFDGDYVELEEFLIEEEKKQTMEEKNYGYGDGDRSIGPDFLEKFPEQTLDVIVGMNMQGGGLGNFNWGLDAGEPLLIIDGARYFTDSRESTMSVLKTYIAAEVESIEVYTFSAAQFGMAGFAGVIMVNTKKGAKAPQGPDQVFNSEEFQIFKIRGFTPVIEFPVQKAESEIPESRPSLYWNPNVKTDGENESFTFSVNLPKTTKNMFLKIEGMSGDGLPFYRIFQIPVN